MTECNAIIEANNEIDRLKRENKKLNELCVQYGFDMGRLKEENEQLKSFIKGTCIFCGANLRQQYIEKYGDIE